MANLLPAPVQVSEHGRGQITIPAHTRNAPSKTKTVVKAPGNATGVPPRTVPVNPVDAQVAAAQLPAQQQIGAAQAASALAAKNQAQTIQGYYNALAGILGKIGPATQQGYSSAAGNDAAFGKGFSDGMQHIQNQTGAEATNIAGIAGAAPPPAPTSDAANALYALGGYIPASTMNREGAAFGAAADLLPATAAGQGAASIRQVGAQQATDQQGFTKQLADLAAQVPGLRAQYQGQADQAAATAATHSLDVAQFRLSQAKANADDVYRTNMLQLQYIASTGRDPTTGMLTPKAKIAYDKAMNQIKTANQRVVIAQQNANTSSRNADTSQTQSVTAQDKARGYWVDANGQKHATAGNTLNPNGTVTKQSAASKWVPGQKVVSTVGSMRVNGFSDDKIAGQLKKWHPGWTAAQIAATLKAAPKLYGDMTKTQVASLRARVASLRSGFTYNPKNTAATVTIGGKTYKAGDTIPPIPYGQAVTFLVAGGYSRTDAVAMLNGFYPKGKRK